MQIFSEVKKDILESSCIALGMFDGIHQGHKKVLLDTIENSKKFNVPSVVVTFKNHPQSVLKKNVVKNLSSVESRIKVFELLGIDIVFMLDFDADIALMNPEDYLKRMLIDCVHPKTITIGFNHTFGKKAQGNAEFLENSQNIYDYKLTVVEPFLLDGELVSSTLIRKFITHGHIDKANELLLRPFSIKASVVEGDKIGRTIGFPTANINIPENQVCPVNGIYAGAVDVNGEMFESVINIGNRPTVTDKQELRVEAHLLDFDRDIYGQEIEVFFYKKIRNEKKFASLEELKKQIQMDIDKARPK